MVSTPTGSRFSIRISTSGASGSVRRRMPVLQTSAWRFSAISVAGEVIDLDGLESDVYAMHDGLLRDCKHCHRSTLWKRTPADAPDNVGTPEAVAVSAEPAPPLKHTPLP